MLTIGQLARYVGVSTKTIRVYHAKGLLPEPSRDASGYRRYGAEAVVDLVRIRTLAEAGVPLAKIRDLSSATDDTFGEAIHQIDADLTARIRQLRDTQRRLRKLAAGALFQDQADALSDPALRKLYLDYDRAHDLGPTDPFLPDLADRIVAATLQRYDPNNLPGQATDSPIPQLLQNTVNAESPAWQRLDTLIRRLLEQVKA